MQRTIAKIPVFIKILVYVIHKELWDDLRKKIALLRKS